VFKIVNRNEPIPAEPPPLKDFIRMIAMLGGYIGRNNDPPPGPKVMWKGLTRMSDFAMAWEVFMESG
jgi:Transposase Tn5 dimerisation domain